MQSRDFTVNALMYDPFTHLLFDYVGGMQDCQKRRLRCIKEPAQSFTEDLARMLRAVRLSAQTGKTHAMSLQCEHCYITSHVSSASMSLSSSLAVPCLYSLVVQSWHASGQPSCTTFNNLWQAADKSFCGCALIPHGCLFVAGLDFSTETMAAMKQLAPQLLRVNSVMNFPVACDATSTVFTGLDSYSATVPKDYCDLKFHAGLL